MRSSRVFSTLAAAVAVLGSAGLASARPGGGPPPPRPKVVVVPGVVKSVASPNFVVTRNGGHGSGRAGHTQDVNVATSSGTQYLKSTGGAGSAADVVVGAKVQVKGKQNADGSVAAERVLVIVRP